MNIQITKPRALRNALLAAMALGLASLASAHHGNPQAPAPSWEGSTGPAAPAPQPPAQPGG